MSYRHQSNQTADLSQATGIADLIARGFLVNLPYSRDAIYDVLIDRGSRRFETIQIKTIPRHGWTFKCTTRGQYGTERVTVRGKFRNSYHYREFQIDWLLGVKDTTCYYYPLSVYQQYDTISVLKVPSVDIGRCVVPSHVRSTSPILPLPERDDQSLFD